jgi:GNAT superfamily N-acetyltransferase
MNTYIRVLNPATDYPRVVEIVNRIQAEPTSVEAFKRLDLRLNPTTMHRLVALNDSGIITAYSAVYQPPWRPAAHFDLWIATDGTFRQQGIATRLYERTMRFMAQQQATHIFTAIRDDMPGAVKFAQRRGFSVNRHVFDSSLDVASFKPDQFEATVAEVTAAGTRFASFAELGDNRENRGKLYDLYQRTSQDIPDEYFQPVDYGDFAATLLDASNSFREGIIVASQGDRWIGLSILRRHSDTTAIHYMTGVDHGYRGQHIALALKLLAIECGKQHGFVRLNTNNDSANGPILALNEQLGYKRLPGFYSMMRPVRPGLG